MELSSAYFKFWLANSMKRFFLLLFTLVCLSISSVDKAILPAPACVTISNRHRGPRRSWVGSPQDRSAFRGSASLEDLKNDDRDPLKSDLRCDGIFKHFIKWRTDFEFLVCMVGNKFAKQDIYNWKAFAVREKFTVTLQLLPSDDSCASLS